MTPLNKAGQGRIRPGAVLSAARCIGDAVAERNGRAAAEPGVRVPDGRAAAVAARRQRALERLLDPLLEAGGSVSGGGADGDGDLAPETAAFDGLPEGLRLPPHPPLSMLLRDEDLGAATRQLPRFGGARGSHRALPAYKALAREKLRVASAAQQRQAGAARLHAMLRAHASCFSSMLFTAYSAGTVSDTLLAAGDNASIYELLTLVFSLAAVRHHCRTIESAAEQRGVKPASLHVHYTHAAMLSNLADSASTTLSGANAMAAATLCVSPTMSACSSSQLSAR